MINRGLLPTNTYHFTIRQVTLEISDDSEIFVLRIVWTVDEDGDYAWRNIVAEYPLNKFGREKLSRDFGRIGYTPLPEDNEEFLDSFNGVRAKMYISVTDAGRFKKNQILEFSPPTQPAHFNVNKPKDSSHFYHTKEKRRLPIG